VTFRLGAELASRPQLMKPPPILVRPIGVAGRVGLLTMGPKGGKSTTGAGMIAEASRDGIRAGLIGLDESLADSLQRLERFGASLDCVYLDDDFDPETIVEQVTALGIRFLVLDHIGKLAERHEDFGPGSQGDPLLWGRLIAPFTQIAREHDVAIILLDQARRSDGKYAGSYAKAGTVDFVCELQSKDGGLAAAPRGRFPLPAFRVDLDVDGVPTFAEADQDEAAPRRLNVVSERDRIGVLQALQSAQPEGLRSMQWQSLACERTGIGRTSFFDIRKALHEDGLISYASRMYRISPTGERHLAAAASHTNGAHQGSESPGSSRPRKPFNRLADLAD
jgi:hypothetical protein